MKPWKKGFTLAEFLVAMTVMSIVTLLLAQIYVLMIKVYDRMSAHAEMQRNFRTVSAWIFYEFREGAPAYGAQTALLEPNRNLSPSNTLRFTRPINIEQPRTTGFETIRYTFDPAQKRLSRSVEGSGSSRVISSDISSLTFTWINDYTVLVQVTVAEQVKDALGFSKTLNLNTEAYISTRYDP